MFLCAGGFSIPFVHFRFGVWTWFVSAWSVRLIAGMSVPVSIFLLVWIGLLRTSLNWYSVSIGSLYLKTKLSFYRTILHAKLLLLTLAKWLGYTAMNSFLRFSQDSSRHHDSLNWRFCFVGAVFRCDFSCAWFATDWLNLYMQRDGLRA